MTKGARQIISPARKRPVNLISSLDLPAIRLLINIKQQNTIHRAIIFALSIKINPKEAPVTTILRLLVLPL